MAAKTIWWKAGDHDKVNDYRATSKKHDLCPECGAPFGIHGKVGDTLVHPGDAIIVNKGKITVKRPDPMAEALADLP